MIRIIPQPKQVEQGKDFVNKNAGFFLHTVKNFAPEEYSIVAVKEQVDIYASKGNGFFYALQTIIQLRLLNDGRVPVCKINDAPQYYYRGFMLDCARHTFAVDEIKKLIDVAAFLKMNVFHWHLSDDQGFRIESDIFPELTKQGSVRSCDNFGKYVKNKQPYGGYFTKAEIKDIVSYCEKKYITVVPELDMPGHTSAILHVYPELSCKGKPVGVKTAQGIYKDILCAGNEDTYRFIDKLTTELCELFPGKYFHIGGDEAPKKNWKHCEKCRQMLKNENLSSFHDLQCSFTNKVAQMLYAKGKICIGWNDLLKGDGLDQSIIIQRWMDPKKKALSAANNGRKIILSDFNRYYLDYPHAKNSLLKIYLHSLIFPSLSNSAKKNICGLEAPIWTEYITDAQKLETQYLPRLFAVAENAWTVRENKNYPTFGKVCFRLLNKHFKQLGYSFTDSAQATPPLTQRPKDMLRFYAGIIPPNKKE